MESRSALLSEMSSHTEIEEKGKIRNADPVFI